MNKYKVCVYAICKNEEKFVDRWYESMKEADEIYVLDTGSIDNTVEKLQKYNINVKIEKINPWRFDVARNISLDMVPLDTNICVCTDLDEVFNPGWRIELEKVWKDDTTNCRYTYNWSLNNDNTPIISFLYEKIHARKCGKWKHPVHEILEYEGSINTVINENIILNHYPDKNKSRSSYLPLLELSVIEDPNNDRNLHYLGREYMYYKRWNDSIDTLIKHLKLKSSTWKDERSASMRFISRCYINLDRIDEAKMWLSKAIEEAPYLRDPYIEMALLEYSLSNWKSVIEYCNRALNISTHQKTYINETFSWDHTVYDLLSIAYFNIEEYDLSLKNINKAIEIAPNIKRLIDNKNIIIKKVN